MKHRVLEVRRTRLTRDGVLKMHACQSSSHHFIRVSESVDVSLFLVAQLPSFWSVNKWDPDNVVDRGNHPTCLKGSL